MRRSQQGFTLIEIMVVVAIIAVVTGISTLAMRQALNRPESAQAERVQSWLQLLVDRARIEGSALGVVQEGDSLRALAFYRRHWLPLSEPAPMELREGATLEAAGRRAVPAREENDALTPLLTIDEGRWQSVDTLVLRSTGSSGNFQLALDDETGAVTLEQGQR